MTITRIRRVAPHQNAKVLALLFAATSLVFIIPMVVVMLATSPVGPRPSMFVFLLMPLGYLVFGYLSVLFGCWAYNLISQLTGGLEFES